MIDFNKYSGIKKSEIQNLIKNIKNNWKEKINKHEAYKKILSIIDLTTLEGSDTEKEIISLCKKAKGYKLKGKGIPNLAAVCVYPTFVKIAKKNLEDTRIKVASVAGAFPSGQSPLFIKIEEVKYAINEGADEIDMVISRGKFLKGNYQEVFDEIAAIKEVCGDIHLKVILETGELESLKNIRKASEIAINAGADFIKTSTGKISPAATEPAFIVMLDTIKEYLVEKINPKKQKDGSRKQMRDVWSLPLVQGKERLRGKDGRALHPTQKPEEMLKRIIIASSLLCPFAS